MDVLAWQVLAVAERKLAQQEALLGQASKGAHGHDASTNSSEGLMGSILREVLLDTASHDREDAKGGVDVKASLEEPTAAKGGCKIAELGGCEEEETAVQGSEVDEESVQGCELEENAVQKGFEVDVDVVQEGCEVEENAVQERCDVEDNAVKEGCEMEETAASADIQEKEAETEISTSLELSAGDEAEPLLHDAASSEVQAYTNAEAEEMSTSAVVEESKRDSAPPETITCKSLESTGRMSV